MFVQTLFIAIEKKRGLFICRTYRLTCEQRNVYMTILEVSRTIYCLFCGLNGRIIHTVPGNLCKLPRFNMASADVGLVRKDAANTGSCLHCFLHCHLENRFLTSNEHLFNCYNKKRRFKLIILWYIEMKIFKNIHYKWMSTHIFHKKVPYQQN